MTRIALIALVLSACADDAAPSSTLHDVVDCDSSWNGRTTGCERACETVPPNLAGSGDDMPCFDAVHADYMGTLTCHRTFEFEGVRGCCEDNGPLPVRFFECCTVENGQLVCPEH